MTFRFAALTTLSLVALGACASATSNQKPSDLARRQAADPSSGHPQDITVRELGHSTRAEGALGTGAPGVAPRGAKTGAEANATPGVAASTIPYEDARTPLRAAAGGLRSWRPRGKPNAPRAFEALLRFEPSGKVSRVDLTPADGAAAAACVRGRLSEIAVTSFTGDPVTVKMPVRL
jgi:hypothetical protein